MRPPMHPNLNRLQQRLAGMLLLWLGAITPGLAAPDAMTRLLQSGEVVCEPSLPLFCSNIHVACAGPSSIRSFPFRLRAAGTRGALESGTDAADVTAPYAAARVEWGEATAYVILRPQQGNGYVKLLADGSYSFRHYGSSGALMSRGKCL